MPRMSITLTDDQHAALERISAATGATKQSLIGLAISTWIRENAYISDPYDLAALDELETPDADPGQWVAYCRMWSPVWGDEETARTVHNSESEAVKAAKLATRRAKAAGWESARPMWLQVPTDAL